MLGEGQTFLGVPSQLQSAHLALVRPCSPLRSVKMIGDDDGDDDCDAVVSAAKMRLKGRSHCFAQSSIEKSQILSKRTNLTVLLGSTLVEISPSFLLA